jgi:hypothetical protein
MGSYVHFFLIVNVISPDSWLNSFNAFMTAGELIFVSDRDGGFWNLYRWGGKGRKLEALYPLEAEFTRPAWIFGNSSFAFTQLRGVESAYQIVCTYRQRGVSHLAILDPSSLTLSTVKTAFTDIYGLVRVIQPIPQTHHSLEFT